MNNADKKLEIGLESICDRIRRPIKRCYLTLAVTQNVLQGPEKRGWLNYKNVPNLT